MYGSEGCVKLCVLLSWGSWGSGSGLESLEDLVQGPGLGGAGLGRCGGVGMESHCEVEIADYLRDVAGV